MAHLCPSYLVLDTYCFNLNPNRYAIYMLDIFGSYEATVLAYYLGVTVVLTLGMQSGYGLCKLVDKIKGSHQTRNDEIDEAEKLEKNNATLPQA